MGRFSFDEESCDIDLELLNQSNNSIVFYLMLNDEQVEKLTHRERRKWVSMFGKQKNDYRDVNKREREKEEQKTKENDTSSS